MTSAGVAEGQPPARPTPKPVGAPSISAALAGHRNSLGILRLVLASLVIFDHAFPLGGFGPSPLNGVTGGQTTLGGFAVIGFFAISGYLIAKSGVSADILQFLWRRFLRIFPAFWTVLLVAAFVVGPIIWVVDGKALGDYFSFSADGPFGYLAANWTLTIGTYGIHDVFTDTTPYGESTGSSVFNGSLWTLAYEWGCYLLIGALVLFGVLARARFVLVAVTVVFALAQTVMLVDPAAVGALPDVLEDGYRVTLTLTFLFGSCIALFADKIPALDGLGVLSGLVMLVTLRFGGFDLVGTAATAYFLLYLGARLPKAVQWIGAKNDYSYGIYIYGFLTQQILAYLGVYRLGYVPFVLSALVASAALAWLSWHLVEKRAMALKDVGPGRGLRFWLERARGLGGRLRRRDAGRRDADDTSAGRTEPSE